jgi:cytidylate kinase
VDKKINIAIDGYSSCGKSTLAKALAKELNYSYVDSGAMYRAITLYAINAELAKDGEVDRNGIVSALDHIDVDFVNNEGVNTVRLNGVEVEGEIRSMSVSNLVSQVSRIAEVREKLRLMQQDFSERGGVVMDGRDIGSAVLPNAELKIFMTADKSIRTQRRYDEMMAKGTKTTLEEVRKNIEERDHIDTTRKEDPLVMVPDARILDNSDLSESEQLEIAIKWAREIIHS